MSWTRIPSRIASRRIVNASVKVNMLPIYYCPESTRTGAVCPPARDGQSAAILEALPRSLC